MVAGTGSVQVQRVFPRLTFNEPVGIVQVPESTDWWVFERTGRILRVTGDDPAEAGLVIDLSDRVDAGSSEGGLLGLAFHPRFAQNGRVYISYTRSGTPFVPLTSVVARLDSNDSGLTLDPTSEAIVLTLDQPFANHNGGHIVFGPDGFLYAGFGDGGSAGDPEGNAQDTDTLFGKILRLDVDSAAPYAVPVSNPFAGGGGRPEVWAYGFRNPWRFHFDRATGELWAGDVGQDQWEEVDIVTAGGNYGWNIREGAHCFQQTQCVTAGLIDPVVEYDHTEGCSITGGFVYRGSAIPALMGSYVYGDVCSGRVWAFSNGEVQVLADTTLRISSFAEDTTGELLIVDLGGTIHGLRTAPAVGVNPSTSGQRQRAQIR